MSALIVPLLAVHRYESVLNTYLRNADPLLQYEEDNETHSEADPAYFTGNRAENEATFAALTNEARLATDYYLTNRTDPKAINSFFLALNALNRRHWENMYQRLLNSKHAPSFMSETESSRKVLVEFNIFERKRDAIGGFKVTQKAMRCDGVQSISMTIFHA